MFVEQRLVLLGAKTFGPVEDVVEDGQLGLHQRVQLRFQQLHNVLQLFDDAPIESDAQLI